MTTSPSPHSRSRFRRSWLTRWHQWRRRRRATAEQAIGLRDDWAHWRATRRRVR